MGISGARASATAPARHRKPLGRPERASSLPGRTRASCAGAVPLTRCPPPRQGGALSALQRQGSTVGACPSSHRASRRPSTCSNRLPSPPQIRRVHLAAAAILNSSLRDQPSRRMRASRRLFTKSPQQTSPRAPGTPGSHVQRFLLPWTAVVKGG
ncbi:hypothetical protein NDU88_005178 [Pleurodeles waltl]|uniref:Uncharacterized protein n=1 Tax=Pleurodeles waltl TaxID=8319 RepID=A0AAV7MXA1_PLEWA|nr:hypothetical protein NDU88_005178 [Pleurodeles waltl]